MAQGLTESWQMPGFGLEPGTGLFHFLQGSTWGHRGFAQGSPDEENWLPPALGYSTVLHPCGLKDVQLPWRGQQ